MDYKCVYGVTKIVVFSAKWEFSHNVNVQTYLNIGNLYCILYNVLFKAIARAVIEVSGHQYRWLAGGYDLEIGHVYKWLAWWLPTGQWFSAQCTAH